MSWREWIVTFGGAGKSPIAPGTAGSIATAVVIALLYSLIGERYSYLGWNLTLFAGVLAASYGMVVLGPWAVRHFGRKDPQNVVLDEAAGMLLTMLFLPIYPDSRQWLVFLVAFAAFRLFDVIKPPPCQKLEKLPSGWGILGDDLMAGLYANVLSQVITRLLI